MTLDSAFAHPALQQLLHLAAFYGHQAMCDLLLEQRATVDAIASRVDMTPLQLAIHECHCDVVTLLVARSANILVEMPSKCNKAIREYIEAGMYAWPHTKIE